MNNQREELQDKYDCDWTHHIESADETTRNLGYLYYQKGLNGIQQKSTRSSA